MNTDLFKVINIKEGRSRLISNAILAFVFILIIIGVKLTLVILFYNNIIEESLACLSAVSGIVFLILSRGLIEIWV